MGAEQQILLECAKQAPALVVLVVLVVVFLRALREIMTGWRQEAAAYRAESTATRSALAKLIEVVNDVYEKVAGRRRPWSDSERAAHAAVTPEPKAGA